MYNFLAIIKNPFKFIWKYIIPLCFIVSLILFLVPHYSKISIDTQGYNFDLPVAIKLIALKEREKYFNVWIDKIIAPNIQDPKEKVDEIFDWVAKFKEHFDWVAKFKKEHEGQKGFCNIEQHEYYILINQYGNTNHLVRVFCVLVTVAGYQAIPFESEADGRVVVRIPSSDKWLYYDFGHNSSEERIKEISLEESVKEEIKEMAGLIGNFKTKRYTRGDKNILSRRISFEFQKGLGYLPLFDAPRYIREVNNKELLWE